MTQVQATSNFGQPSTTLSGGEAQRVKLATELSKKATGKTLYILDEPTTGLHIADVHKLVDILQRLVDTGNSIIVIEHNLDLIKTADHIIDLGPEGGDKGGQIIAVGSPEQIARNDQSYTGKFLKKYLNQLGVALGTVRNLKQDREEPQGKKTKIIWLDQELSPMRKE